MSAQFGPSRTDHGGRGMSRRRQVAARLGVGVLGLVLLGGAGGAVAGAAIGSAQILDNSVRSRDVRDGTLRPQDLAPATAKVLRGPVGPPGSRGEKGDPGGLGPTSIAQTVGFFGPVPSIAPNSGLWVFAGHAEVVTTAGHPRVVAAASAGLGYAPGSAAGYADLGLCYQPTSGGTIQNFYGGGNYPQYRFSAERLPYTATATVVLPAGNYLVGLCVRNNSSHTISNNNYVNGYAQVTQ